METINMMVSIRRIRKFLSCPDLEEQSSSSSSKPEDVDSAVKFKNADYGWIEGVANPTLSNMNIDMKKGELIAVVGKIGSGKSSLLSAILGEMQKIRGDRIINGRISYVAQQAWIQNLTLKDNVLFSSRHDEERYQEVDV